MFQHMTSLAILFYKNIPEYIIVLVVLSHAFRPQWMNIPPFSANDVWIGKLFVFDVKINQSYKNTGTYVPVEM